MFRCPGCNSQLVELKNKLVCDSTNDCDFSITKTEWDSYRKPWHEVMADDSSCWWQPVFEEYPSVIAHEYWRLRNLLREGQVFGALLQLKDVFEVLLKFPVLALAADILTRPSLTDGERKLIVDLMSKLQLGNWVTIARTMINEYDREKKCNATITEILQHSVNLYNDYDISKWRNETIGHGALRFQIDDPFKDDIKQKVELLRIYFKKVHMAYSNLNFCIAYEEKPIPLKGFNSARNLKYPPADLFMIIADPIAKFVLDPYIVYRDSSIYFFDSYLEKKRSADIISYPDGIKDQARAKQQTRLNSLYDVIIKAYSRTVLEQGDPAWPSDASVEGDTYSGVLQNILEKLQTVDDFEEPVYLKEWLSGCIRNNPKGVFLMQTEWGTGKTIFVRSIDNRSSMCRNKGFEMVSIRAHYINGTHTYKIDSFISNIKDQLRASKKDLLAISGREIPLRGEESGDECDNKDREDFANLLNHYRQAHERYFDKRKLLVILDGMDEIPANDGRSIFDFIPHAGLLDDGVYLLLTSRTEAENADYTNARLNELTNCFTTRQAFSKDSLGDNIATLKKYLIKHKSEMPLTHQEIDIILTKAENRFLYLAMIKELRVLAGYETMEIPQGKYLFTFFFSVLKKRYGEKFFTSVHSLLAIFTMARDGLTYKEVAYLMGEDSVNFRMLGYLMDIRGFLQVNRTYRGNLLENKHEEMADLMNNEYRDVAEGLVERWVDRFCDCRPEQVDIANDGETYLLAHLIGYARFYGNQEKRLYNGAFLSVMYYVSRAVGKKQPTLNQVERRILLLNSILDMLNSQQIQEDQNIDISRSLAKAYLFRGMERSSKQDINGAVVDYYIAINILEQLKRHGEQMDEDLLAQLYMNRGNARKNAEDFDGAAVDYDISLMILNRLEEEGRLAHEDSLASAYLNRGTFRDRIQDTRGAIDDFDKAITIREQLMVKGQVDDKEGLANAYMNRGGAREENDVHGAISDYNLSIIFREKLKELGEIINEDGLAAAYINRGNARTKTGDVDGAIGDYDRVITIRGQLKEQGRLLDETRLANAYLGRGNARLENGDIDGAIVDYDMAVIIRKRLNDEDRLINKNDLASAYLNRGSAFREAGDLDRALGDYSSAITIRELRIAQGRLSDVNDLANAYKIRGHVNLDKKNINEAIQDYSNCITFLQGIKKQGGEINEDSLADAYSKRGAGRWQKKDTNGAMCDYDMAISIWQGLKKKEGQIDEGGLALAYLNRGAGRDRQDSNRIRDDYEKAITLWELLDEKGQKINEYYMGLAYLGRGKLRWNKHDIDGTIGDYEKAILIWERLMGKGTLLDEGYLAIAYMGRGEVRVEKNDANGAIGDYDKAIDIWVRIKRQGRQIDEYNLMRALADRGSLRLLKEDKIGASNDYDKAIEICKRIKRKNGRIDEYDLASLLANRGVAKGIISDLDKAIEIFERLRRQGCLHDETALATTYLNRCRTYHLADDVLKVQRDYTCALTILQDMGRSGEGIIEKLSDILRRIANDINKIK